jgi:hypothetical protein
MLCRYVDAANALDAILPGFLGIPGAATLRIYSGSIPATLAAAATGLLSTATTVLTSGTLFGAAATTPPITSIGATSGSPPIFAYDPAIATGGVAVFFRILDATAVARLQGNVGVAGSGADLILNTLTFVAGGTFTVTTMDITLTGIC